MWLLRFRGSRFVFGLRISCSWLVYALRGFGFEVFGYWGLLANVQSRMGEWIPMVVPVYSPRI